MPDDLCPWCRGDVDPHCRNGHPTCKWVKCPDCRLTIDPQAHLGLTRTGQVVPWPHALPDE